MVHHHLRRRTGPEHRGASIFINEHHVDVLVEVLRRLDGRSLGVAACVCRRWSAICRSDHLWESLCLRHVSPPPPPGVGPVVVALGGYRRLYLGCLGPVQARLGNEKRAGPGKAHELQLSLSLFCVDYYERLAGSGAPSPSLMFLCEPVNV